MIEKFVSRFKVEQGKNGHLKPLAQECAHCFHDPVFSATKWANEESATDN